MCEKPSSSTISFSLSLSRVLSDPYRSTDLFSIRSSSLKCKSYRLADARDAITNGGHQLTMRKSRRISQRKKYTFESIRIEKRFLSLLSWALSKSAKGLGARSQHSLIKIQIKMSLKAVIKSEKDNSRLKSIK